MSFINSVGLKTLWGTTKQVAKHYEYMVVDPIYVSKLEKGLAGKGLGKQVVTKTTAEAFEDAFQLTKAKANGRNIFKRVWDSLKGIGKDYKAMDIKGIKAAKELKFFGKVGKLLGPIGKRMPLIGNLMAVGFAIPTIISAFSNGGIFAGLKETGKEAFKLGVFTLGAAVGTAIGGPVGGIALGIGASLLADKITGKSYSDKLEEAKEKTAEGTTEKPQTEAPETRKIAKAEVPAGYNQQAVTNPMSYGQYEIPQGLPNYNQGAYPQTSSNPFGSYDMSADLMSQATFGPNTGYAYPKQQQFAV